jgi:predicted TIM-barrel fold metal-dependent hydrolase
MPQPHRIIDAHHHLWDLAAAHRYPWLSEKGVRRFFGDPAPIQRDYLVADFRADIGELSVVASVHVQVGVSPGDELAETLWLEEQHARHGLPGAIIAYCDLAAADREARLAAQRKAPALRGIRQIIGRSEAEDAATGSAGLLDNPAFLEGLQSLARHDLSFDLQLIPAQMERAAMLLAQVPELRVALCHAGSLSERSPEGIARWDRGIRQLARLPNLICKLSGFGMFDKNWSAASIAPQFATLLEAFGPQRLAFGSNFPVDKLALPYAAVWERYFALAQGLSADEQDRMFHRTAAQFYRICDSWAPTPPHPKGTEYVSTPDQGCSEALPARHGRCRSCLRPSRAADGICP